MSDKIELLSKYHEIMNQNLNQSTENGDTETVFTLFQTEWVRILLARQLENSTAVAIDVEVSLPPLSSNSYNSPISYIDSKAPTSRQLLQFLMEHIRYVLALETSGFSVDLVGDGCLMVAYRNFNDTPDAEIFRLLQPPSSVEDR